MSHTWTKRLLILGVYIPIYPHHYAPGRAPHWNWNCCTARYRNALYCNALCCTALCCTALCCSVQHSAVVHCAALHCATLHGAGKCTCVNTYIEMLKLTGSLTAQRSAAQHTCEQTLILRCQPSFCSHMILKLNIHQLPATKYTIIQTPADK